jgi:sphingolipid delta-4 desaturase
MSRSVDRFVFSADPEPHRARTRELLKRHPELRQYIGKNPRTFSFILLCVAIQVGAAYMLSSASWWIVLLVAYGCGAFVSHALWVLIHECSHNLIFSRAGWNMLSSILANLPHVFPSAVSFQRYHMKHHAFQGVYALDADLPSRWEARLIGSSAARKAVWLLLFPLFQVARPPRLREIRMLDRWIVLNMVFQLAFDVAVYSYLGPRAFGYLLASFFFSVGLHPLGARWVQEHYLVAFPQETYSYYGPLNRVAFNVGYHNEHHDLPSVPWNQLPKVRSVAPEMYDQLTSHISWTLLLLKFLFDSSVGLHSRTERVDRNGVVTDAPAAPDLD